VELNNYPHAFNCMCCICKIAMLMQEPTTSYLDSHPNMMF